MLPLDPIPWFDIVARLPKEVQRLATAAIGMDLSVRVVALRSLVGDARAFQIQIENARAELAALPDADLAELLREIEEAAVAVGRLNARGTQLLRRT